MKDVSAELGAVGVAAFAVLGAVGVLSAALAHLPLPAKYAEFFARLATYAANAKFSVNQRDTLPAPKPEGGGA